MPSIEEIRLALRKEIPNLAGQDGENYAKKWLSNSGWEFEEIEQGKLTLSKELKEFGGKRPDFIVDPKDGKSVLLIDAKYHTTENRTIFKLKDSEIAKYRALVEFCKEKVSGSEFDMVFMLFPKEDNGKKFIWVHLDQFINGQSTTLAGELATSIVLSNNDQLWCENA